MNGNDNEGQNPSRPQSATPRSSSPRDLDASTSPPARRLPWPWPSASSTTSFRLQQIGIDGAYDNTTPRTNDGGIAAVATVNPPPIDGTTPAADIRGSNNPADSRISSSTVQCEWLAFDRLTSYERKRRRSWKWRWRCLLMIMTCLLFICSKLDV
ncbi:uncharacterized protein LOC120669483 [Panicum virgatum]|uniref:uncharacterized protein LOC120669483 n=1 Tax=Panicum virgatum TaxID=38727 RepID=UPI0019D50DF3|nr:uncharacterized protein LOC120669483 [Panicum virgatum]